jgi:integrase/recombinase XerD
MDVRCGRVAPLGAEGEQEDAMPNLYKRGDTWWARFKVAGVEYRRSLRTAVRTEAERRLKALKKDVENEALFGLAPPQTWQAVVLSWNTHATGDLSPKTLKRYLTSLKQVRPWLDGLEIRRVDIAKLREVVKGRRVAGASTATIKRDLTAISGVIDHAIEEGWTDENPTLTLRHRRMREKRDPIVLPDEEEIALVKAAAPQRFADAMDFARETGMREDEIFGLKRKQLGTDSITIYGKRNRLRVIPYTRRARKIVERQPAYIGSQYVFWHSAGERWKSPASRFGDIRRRVARKAAHGFRGFRFHDLRHLYAVEYLKAGRGSLYDLQRLLGHASVKTTEIYLAFLTPEQAKAAMHGVAQKAAQKQRFAGEEA